MQLRGFTLEGDRGKDQDFGRHYFFWLLCCVLACSLGNVMCRKIVSYK